MAPLETSSDGEAACCAAAFAASDDATSRSAASVVTADAAEGLSDLGADDARGTPVATPSYSFHAANFQRKENKLGQVYTALAQFLHKRRSADWCFNLLGFDFMVDAEFRVQLIEVNASPTTGPALIPGLVAEIARVALDPLFPPSSSSSSTSEEVSEPSRGYFKLL
eukprot:TRINITY_DN17657_c0_g1_i2.p1 TRINITY_DN17657_c0_g1~~TRINITY_DN17657_c0_g1_i2.p1  ORF type:complete len:182 (-),score=37.26 TRINITY_DN17657_c0_g1_i2:278-778(-)